MRLGVPSRHPKHMRYAAASLLDFPCWAAVAIRVLRGGMGDTACFSLFPAGGIEFPEHSWGGLYFSVDTSAKPTLGWGGWGILILLFRRLMVS